MSEVSVVDDANDVADAAAELFVEATAGAGKARGRALVALTGGSSATPFFGALRSERWKTKIPWDVMEFFFTDERAVPPHHQLSNYALASRELLLPMGVPNSRVHRLRGEAPDAPAEALRAAKELRAVCSAGAPPSKAGAPPRLDIVLLGLGADGHICSLFAGTPEAADRGDELLVRPMAAPVVMEPKVARLTLTPAVVLLARMVVLMTWSARKADVLYRALKGPEDLRGCPAQWIRKAHGRVVIVCDAEAAQRL